MYYKVKEDGIFKIDQDNFWQSEDGIAVMKVSEWNDSKELRERCGIWHTVEKIHFCKMESHRDFLFGTFRVPSKEYGHRENAFAMYIMDNRIIILDDDSVIDSRIMKISDNVLHRDYSQERFIYDFLVSFIEDDLIFLEKIEHDISDIEENVLEGKADNFSYNMLRLKKIIARFYHYYSQLMDVGDELVCNEEEFFDESDLQMFRMYSERMSRLSEETQLLREYAMQVQDVYQSEIGIHQNDVMKMLTIVTTIFLPLTLIAGWYGMNFSYMPELHLRYAYPVIIGLSILVVVISLIIFKKKKYW